MTTPIFKRLWYDWTQQQPGIEPTNPLGQCWVPPIVAFYDQQGLLRTYSSPGSSIRSPHHDPHRGLFQKDGSGIPGDIQAFFEESTEGHIPIELFSQSRFNMLFHNACGIFCLRSNIKEFISSRIDRSNIKEFIFSLIDKPNRLHQAVKSDIDNEHVLASCRVLGLLDKLFTEPLWRAMEQADMTILEMSKIYTEPTEKLEAWSEDASSFLQGDAVLFENALRPLAKVEKVVLRSSPRGCLP